MPAALVFGIWPAAAQREAVPFARIFVTVFQESGAALPGAQIDLKQTPMEGQPKRKMLKEDGPSDRRGEIVFRVPVSKGHYVLRASLRGFTPQTKEVDVEGEQTIDVTFQLGPSSK